MKKNKELFRFSYLSAVLLVCLTLHSKAATFYVDANSANPVAPYADWSTAATNIQDAIDASSDGDTVLVTNGVYASGGRVMAGDLTNRVALNKAVTVQSVNGPFVTIIQGTTTTNGPSAVRCAWLTNNAALIGFTLQCGATRISGSPPLSYGGGAWCASLNALIGNCFIVSNTAYAQGGGVYQGFVRNCFLFRNSTDDSPHGGGAMSSTLVNSTVVSNNGYGVFNVILTNCIVVSNYTGVVLYNSFLSTFSYSDSAPLPPGAGNTNADPKFFSDGVHLSMASPCRGTGTNVATGTDLFGQTWLNAPSMGCAEVPAVPLVGSPSFHFTGSPAGFSISAQAIGQGTLGFFWLKDGMVLPDNGHYSSTQTPNLVAAGIHDQDAGIYQLAVTNSFGSVTSAPAQVVIRFVDATSASPVSPFTNWNSAATTVQEAVDAALPGEIVLVTNGVYASGGRSMTGDLTNRVTIDKSLLVVSVNGWIPTIIQGAWDPVSTNGPLAVRCVWMTNGAVLNGFTIKNGATLTNSSLNYRDSRSGGGGVWCASTNATVSNCVLTNNSGYQYAGGAANGTFNNCLIAGNYVIKQYGGGAAFGVLNNCTVVNNFSLYIANGAGGVYFGDGTLAPRTYIGNCVVVFNYGGYPPVFPANYSGSPINITSSCSDPLPAGTGNIDVNPQFLDFIHISATSPCRGAGSSAYASGADIDGEPWGSPPSMGCDEVVDSAFVGPLSVGLQVPLASSVVNKPLYFTGVIAGRASHLSWSFGDGPLVTNANYTIWHTWTNAGDYPVAFTAFNNDNPDGVSTNLLVHIQPFVVPMLQSGIISNGSFQFQFYGQPNEYYNLWMTTNLSAASTNWQLINILSGNDAPLQVTVPYSPYTPAQFYRIQPW